MRIAYYAIHYGKEWLEWSIRSVKPFVDEVHVFYTGYPSHGHSTSLVCPETALDLKIVTDRMGAEWWNCSHMHFNWEGAHRDYAVNMCRELGADTILVVDPDEVWTPEYLTAALDEAESGTETVYRVFMRHFWRSVKWVCDDLAAPVRILRSNASNKAENYIKAIGKVLHFGYAQSPRITFYKQDIHGHKGEWREGWFENVFMPWQPGQGDVHPTNVNFWTPVPYEDNGELKQLIGDHPYFGKDIITEPWF